MSIHQIKLAEYLQFCRDENKPVNLGYVKYLKGRIKREQEESSNWLIKMLQGK